MKLKKSRLVRVVDKFYVLVKATIRFWTVLFRYGLVYGWLPAGYYTFAYLMHSGEQGESIKYLIRSHPFRLRQHYLASFTLTFLMVISAVLLKLTSKMVPVQLLILVIAMFASLIVATYLTILAYQLNVNSETTHPYFEALAFGIKHGWVSLSILACLIAVVLVAYLNLILGLIVAPSLFFLVTGKMIDQSIKRNLVRMTD
ncbi:hypothetical protein FC15_GL001545 [Lapidilactobacillus concavus DSM 17758]|uniref:Uncharacterized protein n=1 Tax=Lapidilactobacillus concavus DSM 17758 TaxID=1423735 RepID=A0A0R1W265_9LACO|nr:hypothetical protein FC15_GL001545 [Lapidilactobacillus concavus DSM 17758]GEL13553.1 hypothetical protein LCO01nite_11020 [Lapidilactobacillus concavus]